MEAFLDFFEAMPSWQKLVWIVACMSVNLLVEGVRPMFQGGYRSWKHTRTNLLQGFHLSLQVFNLDKRVQNEHCVS